uniref:Uncharacterized protein n=1 Tax=Arundo donax TaxID=35708 RepID=A0A0A8YWB3_ARUDO
MGFSFWETGFCVWFLKIGFCIKAGRVCLDPSFWKPVSISFVAESLLCP